jgi:hypothetical protein
MVYSAPNFGQRTQHLRSSYSTSSMLMQMYVNIRLYHYINARLAYGFGKATACLYQRLFMSTIGYIN